MTCTPNLFGLEHAEILYDDIAQVWELDLDGQVDDRGPWVVVESTARRVEPRLAADLLEWVVEEMLEDSIDEVGAMLHRLCAHPEHVAAVEHLRSLLIARCGWTQAVREVARHTITLTDDDEPLVDGEPMYVPRQEAKP